MKKLFTIPAIIALLLSGLHIQAQTAIAPEVSVSATDVQTALKMLNGSWKWIETRRASRGTKPVTQTPESSSRNLTVTFKPDYMADVYLNDKLAGSYTYAVTQRTGDHLMLAFNGTDDGNPVYQYLEQGPITISDNQLYIAGGYNDAGANQTFIKITETKPVKKTTATKTTAVKKKKKVSSAKNKK